MIVNVFKTNKDKNALVVYLETPFTVGASGTHTNEVEALEMARTINDIGYNVDVLDYKTSPFELHAISFRKYDLVIGISFFWLHCALKFCRKNCIVVLYATEAYKKLAGEAQKQRCENFSRRTQVEVKIDRDLYSQHDYKIMDKVLTKVEGIICIGNAWTVSTYRHLNKMIYPIRPTAFQYKKYSEDERKINKNSFLWFGSKGLIHKGLDLCIEVFKNRKEEILYIAGPMDDKVFPVYAKELKQGNIRYMGFLNVRTRKYEEICNRCSFVLFPSCSEGCATSVLTVMAMGLIPIVTKEVGIDVGEFGFQLENDDVDTINKCVDYVITLSDEEILRRKRLAYEYVINNHSMRNYNCDFQEALKKILM